MYPDLSYFFNAIFGTPVDNVTSIVKTFGFVLVLAFIISAWFLYIELKRKANEGILQPRKLKYIDEPLNTMDIVSNALFGFVLGYKIIYLIQHFSEFRTQEVSALMSLDGSWVGGIALALLFVLIKYLEKRNIKTSTERIVDVYPHDKTGDFTITAAISGILGAKIFAIFESAENVKAFLADPIGGFFSGSGLAIYGGLIGGAIGVLWYCRRIKMPWLHMMDATATALIMGYAVGRLGCHLSGDGDWGIPNPNPTPSWWFLPDWLWSYDYPHNVNKQGVPLPNCVGEYCTHLVPSVYPTPLYEAIMSLIIAFILWKVRKRLPATGMLFFLYLILNGIERFSIEQIRVNDKINAFGFSFTQAEFIAVLFMIIGSLGIFYLWRKSDRD